MVTTRSFKKFVGIILIKLVLICGLVVGSLYIPGQSTLQIESYLVTLPSGTLISAVIALYIGLYFTVRSLSWLRHLPDNFNKMLQESRHQKAQNLILEGITAIAAGEHKTAVELAEKALKLDKNQNLTQIIHAHALLKDGQIQAAEELFITLTKSDQTRFLGLRGLALLRQKQHRLQEVPALLQKALLARPTSHWALQQLFEINIRQNEFEKAEVVIEQLQLTGGITKTQAKRSKALLLWVKAETALKNTDYNTFYEACNESVKLAPGLIPAATTLAKYYQESNRHSKAWKTLVAAYETSPHPSYLESLRVVFPNTSSLELYQQAEELVGSQQQQPASLIILSQLAIEAKLWGQARLHLNILGQQQPSQSYFRLMALLEQNEYPNKDNKAEHYLYESSMAPQDPSWVCQNCHHIDTNWTPFCSKCNSFDDLQWHTQYGNTQGPGRQIGGE